MDYQDEQEFKPENYKIDPTISEVNTENYGDDPMSKVFKTQPILEWASQTFYGVPGHDALIELDRNAIRVSGDALQKSNRQVAVLKTLEKNNSKLVDNKVKAAKHVVNIITERLTGARSIMDSAKEAYLAGAEFKAHHRKIQAQTQYGVQKIEAQSASDLIVERAKFLSSLAQIKVSHDNRLAEAVKTEDDTQHALRAQIFRQLNTDYIKHLQALGQYGTPVQNALSTPPLPVYDTVKPTGGAVGQFNSLMRNVGGMLRRTLGL
ncbi:MAG: hypothetical protein KME30_29030 [Iphinoe sp. HA4291-MV1]|jgi:hypothetical protein|nr:hypothetical protein [Iphinoe sp. HA4291-MV1]